MKSIKKYWRRTAFVISLVFVFIGFCALPISFAGNGKKFAGTKKKPNIAPIQSHSGGQTYGEWAANWWQVALETPASFNPVTDTTGENCDVGDVGKVWFLFGAFGPQPTTRSCEIPVGKPLFFPLINQVIANSEGDTNTEEELRALASCVEDAELSFSFNGKPVENLDQYFVESPVFELQFPEQDALFGEDGSRFDPVVDAGFYLLLRPLPPGEYELHWITSSEACDNEQDITYNLTISKGPK